MRVREGSLADKFIRVCDWIDNTTVGNYTTVFIMSALMVGGLMYAVVNYPL